MVRDRSNEMDVNPEEEESNSDNMMTTVGSIREDPKELGINITPAPGDGDGDANGHALPTSLAKVELEELSEEAEAEAEG